MAFGRAYDGRDGTTPLSPPILKVLISFVKRDEPGLLIGKHLLQESPAKGLNDNETADCNDEM